MGALLEWLGSSGVRRVTIASYAAGGPGGSERGLQVERRACFGEALAMAFQGMDGDLLILHGDRLQWHPMHAVPSIPGGAAALVLLCADRFDPKPLRLTTTPQGIIEWTGGVGEATTNLADSGAWLATRRLADASRDALTPRDALIAALASGTGVAGEIAPGYTRSLEKGEGYLSACHDLLSGHVPGCFRERRPTDGILVEEGALVGEGTVLSGTAWLRTGSATGAGCSLDNCVLLPGSRVGDGCRLRNMLVGSGASIPPGTDAFDKYLKIRERSGP
ncbi:hypothetical protein GX411_02560 [Candidatus Fermentibacteria bacterium]|nr:hypothetical protein [Candidatus Fermentibacteria bacterium]